MSSCREKRDISRQRVHSSDFSSSLGTPPLRGEEPDTRELFNFERSWMLSEKDGYDKLPASPSDLSFMHFEPDRRTQAPTSSSVVPYSKLPLRGEHPDDELGDADLSEKSPYARLPLRDDREDEAGESDERLDPDWRPWGAMNPWVLHDILCDHNDFKTTTLVCRAWYRAFTAPRRVRLLTTVVDANVAELCRGALDSYHVTHLCMASCTRLSVCGLSSIARRLTHLRSLDLNGCQLDLTPLRAMTRLAHIDLENVIALNPRDGKPEPLNALSYLPSGTRLRSLHVGDRTDNEMLTRLMPTFTALQTLSLRSCRLLGDEAVDAMCSNLHNLRSLVLSRCDSVSDEHVRRIAGTLTDLRALDLSFCYTLGDGAMEAVASMPALESLDVDSCWHVPVAGLARLSRLQSLRLLSLDNCECVNAEVLISVAKCTRLESLSLWGCRFVGNGAFQHVASLQRLTRLSAAYLDIGDYAMLHTVSKLTDLRELTLSGCRQITDRGVGFISHLTRLKHLNLYSCRSLSWRAVSLLPPQLRDVVLPFHLSRWVRREDEDARRWNQENDSVHSFCNSY